MESGEGWSRREGRREGRKVAKREGRGEREGCRGEEGGKQMMASPHIANMCPTHFFLKESLAASKSLP